MSKRKYLSCKKLCSAVLSRNFSVRAVVDYRRCRIKAPVDSDEEMSGGSRCCFGVLALLVQILLHGELALTLYWIIQYRWNAQGLPFAFRGVLEEDLEKEWNLHPVLMITGFIYCMGQGET